MKKKPHPPQNAAPTKKVIVSKRPVRPTDEGMSSLEYHNQQLLTSMVTSFGRSEKNNDFKQVINDSLLHLNEFNAEFEAEIQKTSMPPELLEIDRRLIEARTNLRSHFDQNS